MRHNVGVVKVIGRKYLQLRWRDKHGKLYQRSSGVTRRREALRIADQFAKQIDSGVGITSLGWYDFDARYVSERLASLRPKTRADWVTASNSYGEIMQPKTIADVTASSLSQWAAELRACGKTESVIARYLKTLRRATTWAAHMRLIDNPPFVAVPFVEGAGSMHARPITREEFERMLAATEAVVGEERAESWRDTLNKYWLSGFRLAEALQIYWDRTNRHHIDGIDQKRPKLRILGALEKGRKDRLYPLTPDFVEYLRKTPEEDRKGPVWCPMTVRGITQSAVTVGRTISLIGEKAHVVVRRDGEQLKYASVHDMRRSFGTRWAPLVKPVVLQQLMRHESIETTMKYYVELNTNVTADEIWGAYGTRLGDAFGDALAIASCSNGLEESP